jgi:hypothetical protein
VALDVAMRYHYLISSYYLVLGRNSARDYILGGKDATTGEVKWQASL